MKFRPWRTAAAAAAVLAGLAVPALSASTASAATTGRPGFQPEFFTILITQASPLGTVHAYGPVRGTGTDTENSTGNAGVFTFPGGTVNVHHTNVNNVQPRINYRACTATAFATGSWRFEGGTGIYRHAAGFGRFAFTEVVVLPHYSNGRCDTNPNAQPVSFTVRVFARGLATTGQRHR
jgi:hypothetical protein